MARSQSLRNLTSAMTRLENAFKVVSELPPGDRSRVLEWAQSELVDPMQADLADAK